MRRLLVVIASLSIAAGVIAAQDDPLVAQNMVITSGTDLYGQQVLMAEGSLINQGEQAYADINLAAAVFDTDNEQVGEGFGYLVNACGAGLLPGFVLQPGAGQAFSVSLELYADDVTPDHVEITATGAATQASPSTAPAFLSGITEVTDREVARIEWIDETSLRYGAGCWRDIFTDLNWYEYNLNTGVQQPITHPKATFVTDALRLQLGLVEDLYFQNSVMSFAPDARRMVYQTELHTIITAEPDGSFKRVLFDDLSNRTLQSITWLRDGNFIASYYGANGEPVLYFTATVDGRVLSEPPLSNTPSLVTPGATPDGTRLVIATVDENGTAGYYLKRAAFPGLDLLFEADPPGNNWPGPLVEQDADGSTFIYIARPVDGLAQLQCFNLGTRELHDLSPLPLQLDTDARAWWSLSPENNYIALGADGVRGGLWLIELDALEPCE